MMTKQKTSEPATAAVFPGGHVLVVVPTLHRGGAERVVSRLSHEWAKTHEVTVAVFDKSHQAYPVAGRIVSLDSKASGNMAMKAWRLIQRIIRLMGVIREVRPSHLIGFMEFANFPLIVAAALTGNLKHTRVSVRNSTSFWFRFQKSVALILYRLPYKVIAVSDALAKELIAVGVPQPKLAVIFNPPPPDKKKFTRPKLAGKYILAVGRLVEKKGFDLLLDAYAGLPATASTGVPDLVILGREDSGGRGGGRRAALAKQAQSLGVANRVHFMGEVTDPENYYAHAEMFVLSSRAEGWPNVIMEAMTYGCPVVSFACPTGPAEIITHNKNGLLVKNGDVGGLTHAIAKLLADPKLRQRLATSAKTRVADFDITKLASLWLK